jgi:4'-phosphopantetheinyl transferase EntD
MNLLPRRWPMIAPMRAMMPWRGGVPCGRGALVADLARAMQSLLPASVAVGWADPRLTYPLLPGEGVPRTTPARLREFAAGRAAARGAMVLLDMVPVAMPMAADRAPVWPQGITGSITHTDTDCLAAVTQTKGVLGIDMERDGRVTADLWPTVLHDDEDSTQATLIFAAKEAVYKAQYPLTGVLFDFHRLHVRIEGAAFRARFCADTGPIAEGSLWTGRHLLYAGLILTAVHAKA